MEIVKGEKVQHPCKHTFARTKVIALKLDLSVIFSHKKELYTSTNGGEQRT